ncbi:MAG: hypothetical protein GW910_03160, partial [Candidatus Altiarchaeum hamiconexum]|nr:hypothetical protein [Candidatus Altarchaeum hamiconexum]NCT00840.1 hypothetical protein [Candidatus Altarchaeum hamiconexum]
MNETNNRPQDTEESNTEKPTEEFRVENGGMFFFIPIMLLFQFKDLMEDVGIIRTDISAIHFHLSMFFMNLFKIARIISCTDKIPMNVTFLSLNFHLFYENSKRLCVF